MASVKILGVLKIQLNLKMESRKKETTLIRMCWAEPNKQFASIRGGCSYPPEIVREPYPATRGPLN